MAWIGPAIGAAGALGNIFGGNAAARGAKKAANRSWKVTKRILDEAQSGSKNDKSVALSAKKANTAAVSENRSRNVRILAGIRDKNIALNKRDEATSLGRISGTVSSNNKTLSNLRNSSLAANQPYLSAGKKDLAAFNYNLGIGGKPSSYTGLKESAATKFLQREGMKGIQGSAAAGGGLLSGATLAALNKNNVGLASQDEGRQMDWLNGGANRGFDAAGRVADINNTYGSGVTQNRQWGATGRNNVTDTYGGRIAQENNAYGTGVIGQNSAETIGKTGINDQYTSNIFGANDLMVRGASESASPGVASAESLSNAGYNSGQAIMGATNAFANGLAYGSAYNPPSQYNSSNPGYSSNYIY